MRVVSDPVAAGQVSVWSFPRPAVTERSDRHVRIEHRGRVIADSRSCVRTLETSHPPSWYMPPADVDMTVLRPSARRSFCEWKGAATYFDVVVDGETVADVAWSYPSPTPPFAVLRDHVAFYAGPLDACLVDGERVRPQPGGFYGG